MSVTYSNIHKFTIRHKSEVESSTHDFPCLPALPLKGQRDLVSSYSYRNIEGTLVYKLVASIPKIMLKFENVKYSDAEILLVDYIDTKILNTAIKDFYLNVKHPVHGWIKGLFTLGSPDIAEITCNFSGNDSDDLIDFELHFIAVQGWKLNRTEV